MSLLTPPSTPLGAQGKFNAPSYARRRESGFEFPTALLTPPSTPCVEKVARKLERPHIPSTQDRKLSSNEISYYLPSRQDGVNDMYLHHRLTSPAGSVTYERLLYVWAYHLILHPLLSSQIQSRSYTDISFHHRPARNLEQALDTAEDLFIFFPDSETNLDLIDEYLNGPRTLSDDRLSSLFVKCTQGEHNDTLEIMLAATHFLGDGMALHTFMNEFYTLLGSIKTIFDIKEMIEESLDMEYHPLPSSLEDQLSPPASSMARVVGAEEYQRSEARNIGGQTFPVSKIKKERKTSVPTFAYTQEETQLILKKCKANGVTIAHAVFALCNVAWARRAKSTLEPCLIYSALNLRAHMKPTTPPTSYFHLSVGYFNIILPSLLPSSITGSELFWHRARSTKHQTIKTVKSPFTVSRFMETSKVRKERSIKWAKIDDEEARARLGTGLGIHCFSGDESVESKIQIVPPPLYTPPLTPPAESTEFSAPSRPAKAVMAPAPQKALMGVSMLGNLDGMYKHASYPDLVLEKLTTGSRQRPGGLLLFAYTFAGKLWLSLGYDVNGYEQGAIEGFWAEVQSLVREVLL